ncbi:lipopolysaccharide biosynthesis protein [Thermogutta sp.]|uniref:lipopolysaccharide biosynthesis protein n=1 Tax=Thermogutta sp. TaxID=1962930 RepID=UPI003C7B06C2
MFKSKPDNTSEEATARQNLLVRQSSTLPPLSIRRNFAWYLSGNVTQAVSRLLVLVLLIKLGGLADTGRWVAAVALCAPIFAAFELGLRNLLVCDVQRRFLFQDYFSIRVVGASTACLVTPLAALVYTANPAFVGLVVVVAAGRMFDSLADIGYAVLQREERMDRIGAGFLLRYGLSLVGVAGALAMGGGVFAAACVDTLTAAGICFRWALPHASELLAGMALSDRFSEANPACLLSSPVETVQFRRPHPGWLKIIWESLPAGVVNFEINLITNIPRYVVDMTLGKEALAVFASALQIAAVGQLFVSAMANALAPRLARCYHALELRRYVFLLSRFTGVTILFALLPLAVVETAIGQQLIAVILTPRILDDPAFLRGIVVAACVLYMTSVLGRGVESLGAFRQHMVIRGATVLFLLALLPVFTAWWGMRGTAVGLTLALAGSLPFYMAVIASTWSRALKVPPASVRDVSMKKAAA